VKVQTPPVRSSPSDTADLEALEHVFERVAQVLDEVGYLKPKSRSATLLKLRRLLMDLELTRSDVRTLGGVVAQVQWKLERNERREEK
jgi:tRNA C32,U32 (ribose-2'-O)-methylase TrmJ